MAGMAGPATRPDEPVRRNIYVPAAVVAGSTFLGALALVDHATFQAVCGAGAAALTQFAFIAYGVERARGLVTPTQGG